MKLDVTYQGAVMQMQDATLYSIRPDGQFAAAYPSTDAICRVALTGYTAVSPRGNTHYQTTSGYWIFLPDGWTRVGTQAIAAHSTSQAQALVDKIIANNRIIVANNLLCARFAKKLTEEQQAQVRELQNRLISRNEQLQADGLTTNIKTSYPAGYAELSAYLEALMQGEAIGVATWVVIVIACTIVAGMGTAAYFAYKALADESEADVKWSKELTATLMEKLTPEEYEQLKAETKGIVTKSKIKQMLRTSSKWLVVGALAAAYLIYKIK